MTTYNWKTVDFRRAEVGDLVVDDHIIAYIEEITFRGTKRDNVISPEVRVTVREYRHEFRYTNDPGAGYGIPCYKNGKVKPQDEKRLEEIKAIPNLRYLGVEYWDRSFNEAGSIECVCGAEVFLDNIMTNTCERCDRDYNINGQLLAPRSQWGEETGEYLSDILSSDRSING